MAAGFWVVGLRAILLPTRPVVERLLLIVWDDATRKTANLADSSLGPRRGLLQADQHIDRSSTNNGRLALGPEIAVDKTLQSNHIVDSFGYYFRDLII